MLRTRRLGRMTWDVGAVQHAVAPRTGAVILGPALSSLSTWATLVVRRLLGRRTYLWGQCGRPGDRSLRRWTQEMMNRLAHGLLVYGEAEARAAQELGVSSLKVHIVRNASEDNEPHLSSYAADAVLRRLSARTSAALEEGEVRILHIGRIVPTKRPEVLLDAVRILKDSYSKLRLDVIGGGEMVNRLRESYPDAEIRFHGSVYAGQDREELIRNASVIVSPYHMGLLAIDALRFGIPALVPDNPMNASEVEALTMGVNALEFAAGDSAALANAVRRWFHTAIELDTQEYIDARDRGLRDWDPRNVAARITDAVVR